MEAQTRGKYRKEDTKLIEHSEKVQPMGKEDSGRRGHKDETKAIYIK